MRGFQYMNDESSPWTLSNRERRIAVGLGPRKKDNDMRDHAGKMVNPKGGKCVDDNTGNAKVDAEGGGGTPNKQYKQTGKKYSGPNYPQKDTNVTPFSGK